MSSDADADRIRIGLLWHSARAPNLGVGALTLANIAFARHAAAQLGLTPEFTILGVGNEAESYAPSDVRASYNIDRRFLFSRNGYRAVLDQVDCLLDIGAGDSFADIYGARRFAFQWLTKAIAIAKRKPLLLSPQTIGPFTKRGYGRLAAWAMNRAELVVARDPMSMHEIRRLAPGANALQSVDVAFALPFERRERSTRKPRVGLNVSGMLFNEASAGRNTYGIDYDYAAFTRALLALLTADERLDVELITHVSAPQQPIDDDGAVANRLAAEFPGARRVPAFHSPSDAKSHISGLDFLISGRMHSCIAAFSSGVPFVATAYSRKFEGLFGMLGYPATLPQRGANDQQALDYVIAQLDAREALAQYLVQSSERVETLLGGYEDALAGFFQRVVKHR